MNYFFNSEKEKKAALLEDFLHVYLNYTNDELLANEKVEEARIILSRLDSHLYLWGLYSYETVPYKDIKERLQKLDEHLKIYFK